MNKIRIILAGTHQYSLQVYEKLKDQINIEIVGILSNKPSPRVFEKKKKNKSYKFQVIDKFPAEKIITKDQVLGLEPDLLLSVMYDSILDREFIDSFPQGSWNVHPGILPKYRGRNIFYWTIINEEIEQGITFHELVEELDAGKILGIESYSVEYEDTPESLYFKTKNLISDFVCRMIKKLIEDDYELLDNYLSSGSIFDVASVNYNNLNFNLKDFKNYEDFSKQIRAYFFPFLSQYPVVNFKNSSFTVKSINDIKVFREYFKI